jgi:flagellar biosynthetic protein FlhB
LVGGFTLWLTSSHLSTELTELLRNTMANAPYIATSDPSYLIIFKSNIVRFFTIISPVLVMAVVVGFTANVIQVGFKISTKAIQPKLEKINPLGGLKKMFSIRSLVTLFRDTFKLLIIGFVAYKVIASEFDDLFLLPEMTVSTIASTMGTLALSIALKVGAAILVIALLDYFYQKYEFEKSIRMTKQEIRDEFKDTEGSPQVKARVRQIQREMSRKRMMDEVSLADVVVTNPTHLAVALKYSQDAMTAPQVVAKGERLIAQKIKDIALENNIPIVEDKPLARSLYKLCDVGDVVPETLFRAVAEILAYVYKMKDKAVG